MKLMKLLLAGSGILIIAAVSAYAGGLADAVVETQPIVMSPDEPSGSVPSWVIPVAIIAVLAGVAVLSGDDDDSAAS
ncbi:hypothetical protein [Yoonia sp. SDW83-1]|uniref:hypothetical protein n=1 Tax=Yoonia sp. SDW83-1 TaxID=3366945 RepID=UPI00398C360D